MVRDVKQPELWRDAERRRLVRLCAVLTGNREAAEDLAQETLLEAWRNRHKLHDPAGADRWLSAIARNVCLRWARGRGRELPFAEADGAVEVELERPELEELLDRALSLLPPTTRDVLVHHYVHESPQAEIAARLGISEAAVSMRVSRGKVELRRLLAAEEGAPDGVWDDTRVWCTCCGARRVQMRRDASSVAFRCPGCSPTPSAVYDFENPHFARLVRDLVRPTAILRRAGEWSASYFANGAGDVACTRCGSSVRLVHYERERRGLFGDCVACGLQVWTSVVGLAHSRPEVRTFARTHGRVRTLPLRELRYGERDATLVRLEAVTTRAELDVFLERRTLRPLAAH